MLALSSTSTCPASVAAVAEDGVVADGAVVRDVGVGHQQVVVADAGHAAAARRAAMDGHELADHVAVADHHPRRLAAELQVLRHQADRGHREDFVVVADLGDAVDDARRADPAVTADADVLADRHVRPDDRARADLRAGMHDGRRMDLCELLRVLLRDALDAHQQGGFRRDLPVQAGDGAKLRERPAPRPRGHFQRQTVARDDAHAELRLVDAAQPGAAERRAVGRFHQQDRRHLRQRLDHEHAGHQRLARKMSLEDVFVDRDVLDGRQAPPRLVLGDRIDQRGGIPVAEPFQGGADVSRGHEPKSISLEAGRC
jgi:hypothetical protein